MGKLAGLCRLLDEYGDEIEADLLRVYQIDLLDFYRGALSVRRLGLLIRHLPADSALVLAMNGGRPQWSLGDHLTADLWALQARKDHPRRVAMEEKARTAMKQARVLKLRTVYENKKRTYGLG